MNYQVNIINNLVEPKKAVSASAMDEIASLLQQNYSISNDGTYMPEELERLLSNKTARSLSENAASGLLVYLTNQAKKIIAVGMVVRKDDRYEAKTLNVSPDYKGQGLGREVCDIREAILHDMGIRECFIESLKFPKTIAFHKSRGYEEFPSPRKLYFTVYMRKQL